MQNWNCLKNIALSVLCTGLSATPSVAQPQNLYLPGGHVADAPLGFSEMCKRQASICQPLSINAVSRATAGKGQELQKLKAVNAVVNRRIIQRSDTEVYGAAEVWTLPARGHRAMGDCEDLALEKQMQLLKEGYSPAALRLAVTYSSRTGLHTVLVARTSEGDFVLDSSYRAVLPWYKTDYVWLRQQSRTDPETWLTIDSIASVFADSQKGATEEL